jgi:hypothetical protein
MYLLALPFQSTHLPTCNNSSNVEWIFIKVNTGSFTNICEHIPILVKTKLQYSYFTWKAAYIISHGSVWLGNPQPVVQSHGDLPWWCHYPAGHSTYPKVTGQLMLVVLLAKVKFCWTFQNFNAMHTFPNLLNMWCTFNFHNRCFLINRITAHCLRKTIQWNPVKVLHLKLC